MATRSYGSGRLFARIDSGGRETWYGSWHGSGRRVKRRLGVKRRAGTCDGLTRTQAGARLRRRMVAGAGRGTVEEAGGAYIEHLEHVMERNRTRITDGWLARELSLECGYGAPPSDVERLCRRVTDAQDAHRADDLRLVAARIGDRAGRSQPLATRRVVRVRIGRPIIQQRMESQDAMRSRFEDVIERATGLKVIWFMSGNQHVPAQLSACSTPRRAHRASALGPIADLALRRQRRRTGQPARTARLRGPERDLRAACGPSASGRLQR